MTSSTDVTIKAFPESAGGEGSSLVNAGVVRRLRVNGLTLTEDPNALTISALPITSVATGVPLLAGGIRGLKAGTSVQLTASSTDVTISATPESATGDGASLVGSGLIKRLRISGALTMIEQPGAVTLGVSAAITSVSKSIPLLTGNGIRGLKAGAGLLLMYDDTDVTIEAVREENIPVSASSVDINNSGLLTADGAGVQIGVPSQFTAGYTTVLRIGSSTIQCDVPLRIRGNIGRPDNAALTTTGDFTVSGLVTATDVKLGTKLVSSELAALSAKTQAQETALADAQAQIDELNARLEAQQQNSTTTAVILPYYRNDQAALAGGLPRWALYRTGEFASNIAMRTISDAPEWLYWPVNVSLWADPVNLTARAWTVETWLRVDSQESAYIVGLEGSSGRKAIMAVDSDGKLTVRNRSGLVSTAATALTQGKWHHAALQVLGNTGVLFLDGIMQALFPVSSSDLDMDSSAMLKAGAAYDWNTRIYVSNIRASNAAVYNQSGGIYTQTFIPTLPLPVTSSTQVLVRAQYFPARETINGVDRTYIWIPSSGSTVFMTVDPLKASVGGYQWY